MSAQHTPTPWHIAGQATIKADKNNWIGSIHWRNRAANAAFIVRAANCHDELVAALKDDIYELNLWTEQETGESFNSPAWNDLLAKAQAQP